MTSETKITIKQWEDYVVTTALLLGWEERPNGLVNRSPFTPIERGPRWRRAMHWLEQTKSMHVCINGVIVTFNKPNPQK